MSHAPTLRIAPNWYSFKRPSLVSFQRPLLFGEASLERAVRTYVHHVHHQRNHQRPRNEIIEPREGVGRQKGRVPCHESLGGLLRDNHRAA